MGGTLPQERFFSTFSPGTYDTPEAFTEALSAFPEHQPLASTPVVLGSDVGANALESEKLQPHTPLDFFGEVRVNMACNREQGDS